MRLLCATGEKHTYAETQISLSCEGYAFKVKGKTVVQNGWNAIEEMFKASLKTKEKEDPMKSLPEVHEGDVYKRQDQYPAQMKLRYEKQLRKEDSVNGICSGPEGS